MGEECTESEALADQGTDSEVGLVATPRKRGAPATQLAEMDLDAIVAASEFPANGTIADVGKWWKKHLWKCGHKRLGRILIQKTGA